MYILLPRLLKLAHCTLLAASILPVILVVPAWATDVTAMTSIGRSGMVLNRTTNTFDSTITLTNISQVPLYMPFRLIISAVPDNVSLQNGTAVTSNGKSYIDTTLPNGQLNQGQSVKVLVKMNNVPRVSFQTTFSVDAALAAVTALPPDPGPSGQTTLLGVDSNGNGIRDDVERYIALNYGSSPNAVKSLYEVARTLQAMLTVPQGNATAAKAVNDTAWRNRSCLVFLFGAIDGHKKSKDVFAEQFNTLERYRAWSRQDDLLAGQAFESPRNRSTTCDFVIAR